MTAVRTGLVSTGLVGTVLATTALLSACSTGGGRPGASRSSAPARSSASHVAQFLPPASPAPVSATTMPPATGPVTTTPSTAAVTRPAPPPAPPVAAGPGACQASQLRLAVGAGNGAAGSIYYPVQFTNTSGVACTLYGYPGVALVSGPGGSVIGEPALRNPTFPARAVTIAPGAIAHAPLQVAVAANYPAAQCEPATAHWLQVYPPGSFTALVVAFTAQTCAKPVGDGSTLGIYVVLPGATGS
jgi:Protein of unknown function (DUF4232)